MAIHFKDLSEKFDITNEVIMEEFFRTMPPDTNRELVKKTCETFTRLLLSLTPFKAKEFVEKNCAQVQRKIMREVNEIALKKFGKLWGDICQ